MEYSDKIIQHFWNQKNVGDIKMRSEKIASGKEA
jgi:NifU-like protein involved in Fe-S cluster formation